MRVDKDEATEFIDAKIAQFKKLETALDEGTFSLETYEAVYKETKIIISRLFSEKEWAKFETEAGLGPEPYIKQFFSDSRRATARFMEQVKQSHISPMLDMTIDQAQQTPEFEWAGL